MNINFDNPDNYISRGFISCKKKNVSFVVDGNLSTALLVCELVPGALDGRMWMYIPSTDADCCEDTVAVEAYDATTTKEQPAFSKARKPLVLLDFRHFRIFHKNGIPATI